MTYLDAEGQGQNKTFTSNGKQQTVHKVVNLSLIHILMLRLRSTEQETKLRLENSTTFRNWKINLGINLDYSQYTNTTFCLLYTSRGSDER